MLDGLLSDSSMNNHLWMMQQSENSMGGFSMMNAANACRTPRQKKLDAAREYLKSRASAHPEWAVRKVGDK